LSLRGYNLCFGSISGFMCRGSILSSLIGLFGLVVGALLLFFGGRPFKSIKTLDVEPGSWCGC